MKQHFTIFTLAFALLSPFSFTMAQSEQDEMESNGDDFVAELRQKYLSDSKSVLFFNGSRRVSEGKSINGDVLIMNGDLTVQGTINGKVVISNGNLILEGSGKITKDAVAVNGKIRTQNDDQILGNIIQVKSAAKSSAVVATEIPEIEAVPSIAPQIAVESEAESTEIPVVVPKKRTPAIEPSTGVRVYSNENKTANSNSGMNEAEMEKFEREMQKFNEKMEAFNRKMEKLNKKMASEYVEEAPENDENANYNYNYNYNYNNKKHYDEDSDGEDESDDEDTDDRSHSASFVRVDDDLPTRFQDRDRDRDNGRYYSRNDYFQSNRDKFKNTSFVLFDYNRVDGLYLGGKIDRDHQMYSDKPFQIYGEAGYSFGQKAFRYQIGLDKVWGSEFRFTLGGEVHDLTSTSDRWLVGNTENALSSILLKIDNRDYFRTEGYSFQAQQHLNPNFKVSAGYKVDTYSSARNHVNWALFRSKKVDFRANPLVDEGTMRSIFARIELNTVNETNYRRKYSKRSGWDIYAEGERSRDSWSSDFDFTRYVASISRYQPLSRWENLDMRVMAGSATGVVPFQKRFYLGGISTLRGFDYKEFSGNQMLLGNLEYRINSGVFKNDRVFPIHPFSAILFVDAGYTWNNQIYAIRELFKGMHMNDLQSNVGIGFGDEKDLFRFDIAKPITQKDRGYRFSMRVNYIF